MTFIKSIILTIIISIINPQPLSNKIQIYILQNIFNTKIFENTYLISFLNLPLLISIIFIHIPKLKKGIKNKVNLNKLIISSILFTLIYNIIPYHNISLKSLAVLIIINAILTFFSTNKKGNKKYSEVTYLDSILIGLSALITFIPSISSICAILLSCSLRKIKNKTSFIYMSICILPSLLISSIPGITYLINNNNYIIYYTLYSIISIFITSKYYKYIKYLYRKNKLYKLSLFYLIISIFILFWFR